jgi:hypothetical protein
MQLENTEAPARDTVEHVVELGVPAAEKVIALGDWDDVLRKPQNSAMKSWQR